MDKRKLKILILYLSYGVLLKFPITKKLMILIIGTPCVVSFRLNLLQNATYKKLLRKLDKHLPLKSDRKYPYRQQFLKLSLFLA